VNQRILAMAKQCGVCDEDGDFYGAKNTAYEQFAELIVRDCVLISRTSTDGFSAGRRMEQHFGVES